MVTQGDDFDRWYCREHKRVLAAVIMIIGGDDRQRCEDAVNDAFVKAIEKWDYVAQMNSPRGWVTKVAVNNAKRSLRLRGQRVRRLHEEQVGVEDRHSDPELWNAVSALPPRQRRALVMRYIEDLTQEQVAVDMGITPGAAAATLNQARRNLRSIIQRGDEL